jgi:hypothetical protein
MNILKFRPPKPELVPKVKTKSKPRLRVVQTEKDVRVSKSVFESGLARFLVKLRERYEYVDVIRDGHRASIFVSPTIRDMQQYAYVIIKKYGAIVDMSGCRPCMRGKVVGNVLNWS